MSKPKKPFYKRAWFWIIILVIAVFAVNQDEEPVEETASANVEEANQNEKNEQKAEEEKTDKPEESKKEETVVDKIKKSSNADNVTLENGVLTIEDEVTTFWNETSILKNNVYNMFSEFDKGFADESVNKINVVLSTVMIDQKGNESLDEIIKFEYSREDFEELNFKNFLNMASSQTWRILNESNSYWIHPGIFKNVDDEYKQNLTYGMVKSE